MACGDGIVKASEQAGRDIAHSAQRPKLVDVEGAGTCAQALLPVLGRSNGEQANRPWREGEQTLYTLQEAEAAAGWAAERRDPVDLEGREDHVARRVAVAASASRNVGVQRRRALVVRGVYPVLERVRILRVVELRAPGSTQQMMPQQVAEAKVGHAHL